MPESTHDLCSPTGFEGLDRLHLIMGLQCNARCTMCYQLDHSPRFNMPDEIWRDRLRDAFPFIKGVKLQGGEPTIMANCRDAARYLRAFSNVRLSIHSNGIRVDEFWHETILEQTSCFDVSINAATESVYGKIVIYGNFAQVISNVERVLVHRRGKTPSVGFTAVVLKENFFELNRMIELAGRMGLDKIEFGYDPILTFHHLPGREAIISELARCEEQISRFPCLSVIGLDALYGHLGQISDNAGRIKKPRCAQPFRNLFIDWNGDVKVCSKTWVKLGNVRERSLQELWTGVLINRFRQRIERENYNWCSPDCDDNAASSNIAMLNKYVYVFREDPKRFIRKVRQKVKQLNGTSGRRRKPSKPPAVPNR